MLFPFEPPPDVDGDVDEVRDNTRHALGDDAKDEPSDAADGADEEA